jgi:hypothetical protein
MEFEEIKKIWDMQNKEMLYVINEKAMHNRILSKKRSAGHIANVSELLLIIVNMGTGIFILGTLLYKSRGNVSLYLLAAWTFMTALYILISRIRRRGTENRYDRSMLGDLDHAISNAGYQVRLSGIMRWNVLPIGLLTISGLWESASFSLWIAVSMLAFFVLTWYGSRWEHGIYKKRKHELEILQQKLKSDEFYE